MGIRLEVEQFLRNLKEKARIFGIAFMPRSKNSLTLTTLEMYPDERIAYIMNLKVEDYYSGPNIDTYNHEKPDYYEFGLYIKKKIELYIKISLGLPNKMVECMSFHIAERPITYPFKDQQLCNIK